MSIDSNLQGSLSANNKIFTIATANLLNFAKANRSYYENTPPYSEQELKKN